ncbi:MAG: PAS domain-containing protein [Allosphingosinicella sp.]|uniref:PAS domain-containing protein n=1 Tax=Allosphingosinicella sp. TaxID=2823234 RepID=UPI0039633270
MSIVIHIVDDDPQVRAATSFLLAGQGYATQVYADGEEFLAQARLAGGCILLDLHMNGRSGLDLLEELPRRGVSLPVIMISGRGELRHAVQAMKLGAVDFLQKPYQEGELIAAIERALDTANKRRGRSEAKTAAVARLERLSPRERQILQGLLAGLPNKAIARKLDLSPRTVEMHRANMMADLGIASLPEAIRLAIDAELAPLDNDSAPAIGPAPLAPAPRARGAGERAEPVLVLPEVVDALEGTTDYAFLLDGQWRFTYLNANARELMPGRDPIGEVIWDVFPLSAESRARELMYKAAADRQPVRFEFYQADLGRWFDVNVRPMPSGQQVFFRDVTPERKARASLKMSEETLRLVLEATGDGAWDWNIATGEIDMSPRLIERLGHQPTLMTDRFERLRELIHPDDWAHFSSTLNDHLEGRTEIYSCEFRIRGGNGGWMWNFDRGRVVARDPETGAATRMVGSSSDITERKDEQARAQEAFERLNAAQRGAGAGTWDLDFKTRRIRHCPRSNEMHGLRPDHPETLTLDEWEAQLHPDDVATTRRRLEQAFETGDSYRAVFRTRAGDGGHRWVLGLGEVIRDENGEPERIVGLDIDITRRKEIELELERVRSELVQVSRLSTAGAMAGVLAHELSPPLTAIDDHLRGIRRAITSPAGRSVEQLEEALAAAERSADHAVEIIRRFQERATLDDSAAIGWESLEQTGQQIEDRSDGRGSGDGDEPGREHVAGDSPAHG